MNTIGLLEELARDVGWGGGLLYLVDLIGGRLRQWRIEREIHRRFMFPGSGTPPPPLPPELRRIVDGDPSPASSRPAGAVSSSPPAGGRGRAPR